MHTIFQLLIFSAISMYGFCLLDVSSLVDCLPNSSNESYMDNCDNYTNKIDLYPQVDECTETNITVHCTGGDQMMIKFDPGLYIIEQSLPNNTWTSAKLVRGGIATFTDLMTNTNYRYRLYNLTYRGISRPKVSDWFSTYPADYEPLPVRNISLLKTEPNKRQILGVYSEIAFEPATDRSCSYDVVVWNGESRVVNFNADRMPEFILKLKFLRMDQNNNVTIVSVNRQNKKSSPPVSMWFHTNTCLEYYENLTFCSPEPVEGLQADHIYRYQELYDVWVRWNKSRYEPDNYTILIDLHRNEIEFVQTNVPGNTTEVRFSKLKLGLQYEVKIIAESQGGISPVVTIVKSLVNEYATVNRFYRELLIGITMSVIFVAIVGITYLQYYKQQNKYSTEHENRNQKDVSIETVKKMLYQSCDPESSNKPLIKDKFDLCPNLLKLRGILGSGAYGIVRLGLLQDQFNSYTNVAVKMLKDNPSMEDLQNFHEEILIMKATGQHPNIVSLIGCCILDNKPVLVVEYCCNGDLQTYLRKIWQSMICVTFKHQERFQLEEDLFTKGGNEHNYQNVHTITNHLYDIQQDIAQYTETVTASDLLNFARQIAIGMEFLSLNRIVHRDLAARNILVCADRIVKISDFGLSRDVYQENLYRKQGNGKLPMKWMAIEALTHQIYSTHSDVWSFGILLWEIVTMGALPYPGIPINALLKLLKSGYRMERPASCSMELYNIMLSCWIVRPQSRPTFTQLKGSLDKMLSHHSDNKYLNMDDILSDAQEQYHVFDNNHS